MNGWISEQLSKIAEVGDSFVYRNLSVTVLETDSHRASLVEVVTLPEEADGKDDKKDSETQKDN